MSETVVFDYGVGNLHSLRKALERVGCATTVSDDPAQLEDAPRIVLPGVGAFGPAACRLAPAYPILRRRLQEETPLLGICLGMQLLFQGSKEAPGVPGLGWIEDTVVRLDHPRLPAIGWNDARPPGNEADLASAIHYYFVHSFAAPVGPYTTLVAEHGAPFSAAVAKGSATGFQFHPEKSGPSGLALLKGWAS